MISITKIIQDILGAYIINKEMDMVYNTTQMEIYMREIGKIIFLMLKEYIFIIQEINMKEHSKKDLKKDMVYTNMLMVIYMKENGFKITKLVLVPYTTTKKMKSILENLLMAKDKDMVYINMLMGINILDNGKIIKNKVKGK